MTTVNLAKGANKTLAAVLVSVRSNGTVNDFATRKLKLAIAVATSNAGGSLPDAPVALPADFAEVPAVLTAVRDMTGLTVTTDGQDPLPTKLVEQAEANQAQFQANMVERTKARNAAAPGSQRMQPRFGKTARTGGKTAAEARKRERAARDREIRNKMKGGSKKD